MCVFVCAYVGGKLNDREDRKATLKRPKNSKSTVEKNSKLE